IITILRQRGNYRAGDAIRKLQHELPELDWLKWVLRDAQDETRRVTWEPARPSEILKLAHNHELRLVQSAGQLLDVVVESLKRLDLQLQGETPEAPFLWNDEKTSHGKKSQARPKDEDQLSNYIKVHLEKDLKKRGIILNREVQIHRKERTDIHVDAIVPASSGKAYDSVSVIIEVKGCWNPGINDAMQSQLVDRYLKDNHCQHGLYLVGWFNCQQWSNADKRKGQANKFCPNKLETQARFDAQAREISKAGLVVKALVLDASIH
ncbi:MAG: NACHT domain-containing protein, partial [Nitrospiraceae bacterium]